MNLDHMRMCSILQSDFKQPRKKRGVLQNCLFFSLYPCHVFSMTGNSRAEVVEEFKNRGHVLITTYNGLRVNREYLLPIRWDYGKLILLVSWI